MEVGGELCDGGSVRVLACAIALLSFVVSAWAEPARTKEAVVVRKKANAKAAVAGKLAANTVVVIVREDGAWLQIRATIKVGRRAKEVVGFVARDAITLPSTTGAAPDDPPEVDSPIPRETRKTLEEVVVRAKPGEKQAAVATLPAGTEVIIDAERGRWYRVRAGKVVGYLARTTLTEPATAAVVEPPPTDAASDAPSEPTTTSGARWGRSGPSTTQASSLRAEVTAPSALRADPALDGAVVAEVARGAVVAIVDANKVVGWVRARDEHGAEGWIQLGHLGNGSAAIVLEEPGATTNRSPERASTVTWRGDEAALRVHAGLGYRVLGMDFSSTGGGGLSNYVVTAEAGALDLDVDVVGVRIGKLSFAIDGNLEVSRSSPGIEYVGPSRPGGNIPFSTFDVDGGVRARYRVRRMFELAARTGIHYDAFIAKDVDNVALLPRESLLGATLGARVEIAPAGSRFGATLHVDTLLFGTRRQTPGLEDGNPDVVRATWAGMNVRIGLARHFSLSGGYDFGRVTTQWSGMSVRTPGVTNARRVDSSQLVQVGLSVDL